MKRLLVKVCGMRVADNIRQVEALRPDYMGFICWEGSPRHLTRHPGYLPTACRRVGVFVDPSPEYVAGRVACLGLHAVQLHGHESPQCCHEVKDACLEAGHPVEVIKAFGIAPCKPFPATEAYETGCDYFLFDTRCPTAGGSGRAFDWVVLRNYSGHTPFFLSGGIGPDSLEALRAFAHPAWAGVDLNSRFELAPGVKDVARLAAFIQDLRKQDFSDF